LRPVDAESPPGHLLCRVFPSAGRLLAEFALPRVIVRANTAAPIVSIQQRDEIVRRVVP
jgi:hypothetical protein